HAV
ncbi:putative host specificity protein, partial [Escherichia coli MA6]